MNIDLTAIRQRAEAATPVVPWQVLGIGPHTVIELLDRIESLERALVTARKALEGVLYVGLTGPGVGELHIAGCTGLAATGDPCDEYCVGVQQALTDIAGVGITGADTAEVQP